jgi:hypothetical protein
LEAQDAEWLSLRIDQPDTKDLHAHAPVCQTLHRQRRVDERRTILDLERDRERRATLPCRLKGRDDRVDDQLVTAAGYFAALVYDVDQKKAHLRTRVARSKKRPGIPCPSVPPRSLRQRHGQLADRQLGGVERELCPAPSRRHQVSAKAVGER